MTKNEAIVKALQSLLAQHPERYEMGYKVVTRWPGAGHKSHEVLIIWDDADGDTDDQA